jgi:hypothetical protein
MSWTISPTDVISPAGAALAAPLAATEPDAAGSDELEAESEPDEHAESVRPTSAVAMTRPVRVLIDLIAYS